MAEGQPKLVPRRLREPHLPCIDVGTKQKPVWLPMELCTVVKGQALKKGEQPPATEMLKMATKLPGPHRAASRGQGQGLRVRGRRHAARVWAQRR